MSDYYFGAFFSRQRWGHSLPLLDEPWDREVAKTTTAHVKYENFIFLSFKKQEKIKLLA